MVVIMLPKLLSLIDLARDWPRRRQVGGLLNSRGRVTLQREKEWNPVYAEQLKKIGAGTDAVRELGEKLLAGGPEKLKPAERMAVLADQGVMVWLHLQAWVRPEEKLAPWWKAMIREFSHRE